MLNQDFAPESLGFLLPKKAAPFHLLGSSGESQAARTLSLRRAQVEMSETALVSWDIHWIKLMEAIHGDCKWVCGDIMWIINLVDMEVWWV